MAKYPWLSNQKMLEYIDTLQCQTKYVNLVVLDNQDQPIKAIKGRATGGSINIDSASIARRSGSLSLVTEVEEGASNLDIMHQVTNVSTLLSMNKRLSVEVGIKNTGFKHKEYDIFWFPLGTFLFANASVTYNSNGIAVTMNLLDKMGLLNGELGGTIPHFCQLSPDPTTNEPMLFYDLLIMVLTKYGNLSINKIIIEDVPLQSKTTIRWGGDKRLSLNYEERTAEVTPGAGFDYNQSVGYTLTPFTYPTEETLYINAGDYVTSVLDIIKNKLGNYEYFFDLDGIFHFQQIKNYINEGSKLDDLNEAIAEKYFINSNADKAIYKFLNNNPLTIAYHNTPQYKSIKNDFNVWGKVPDTQASIRYHLLIDDKNQFNCMHNPFHAQESKYQASRECIYSIPDRNVLTKEYMSWNPSEAGWPGQEGGMSKTDNYCSAGQWQRGSQITTYAQPSTSGWVLWDGIDTFCRWYIDKRYERDNTGAAQVLWSRSERVVNPPGEIINEGENSDARKILVQTTNDEAYMIFRLRVSDNRQPIRLVLSYVSDSIQTKKCSLAVPVSQVANNTWGVYVINMKVFSAIFPKNAKVTIDTLYWHFPFALSGQVTVDLDYLGFAPSYKAIQGIFFEQPNDICVEMTPTATTVSTVGDMYKQKTQPTPRIHWRSMLYYQALRKKASQRSLLEQEAIDLLPTFWNVNTDKVKTHIARADYTYWLDILSIDEDQLKTTPSLKAINDFFITNIGIRGKVLPNDDVNCIFESSPENYIFLTLRDALQLQAIQDGEKAGAKGRYKDENGEISHIDLDSSDITVDIMNSILQNGLWLYDPIAQVYNLWYEFAEKYFCVTGEIYNELLLGSYENSAYELLRSALHEYLSYNNNINITTIPVYHLDVNQRITVENEEADIHGDYIINNITIPLELDAQMTINARQAVERI